MISIRYPVRPRRRSLAAAAVADLFGIVEPDDDVIVAENVALDLRPTDLVLFVGPSGSGKSSLLRAAGELLNAINVNELALPDESLIDALDGPVADRLGLLSSCGLAEARLALRTPTELSDGQRARFRLAFALGRAGANRHPVMIDEFAALLDRPLAKVVAFNLRRVVSRTGAGALVATTHEDLTKDLNPDVLVRCGGDERVDVTRRDVKKKRPTGTRTFGSRPAPVPTGRTSLGGITAATRSVSSNG
jgi:hypothetical protein